VARHTEPPLIPTRIRPNGDVCDWCIDERAYISPQNADPLCRMAHVEQHKELALVR
jgi:hypothetical protein